MIEYFSQYLKVTRNVSNRTIQHYISAIRTIETLLNMYGCPVKSIFFTLSKDELDLVKHFITTNTEFIKKDSTGNRMYSAAFNHYYRFAIEDKSFYNKNIMKMDFPVKVPQLQSSNHLGWRRNQILVDQVIEAADYCCENDIQHKTFVSARTGQPFMEGHHIIPMMLQKEFYYSLDVYANVVSICPICHRLLHYGEKKEKLYCIEKILEKRMDRFEKCGISISEIEIMKLLEPSDKY